MFACAAARSKRSGRSRREALSGKRCDKIPFAAATISRRGFELYVDSLVDAPLVLGARNDEATDFARRGDMCAAAGLGIESPDLHHSHACCRDRWRRFEGTQQV